jgi:hypothetical protein
MDSTLSLGVDPPPTPGLRRVGILGKENGISN